MDSFDQTCRRSQEVEARLRQFLARKSASNSIEQANKQIDHIQSLLNDRKEEIATVANIYSKIQGVFSEAVDQAVGSIEMSTSTQVAPAHFIPQSIKFPELAEMLKHASRIIVLTGSGLSEASGLPYYGSQGFWREEEMSIDLDETDSSIDQEVLLTKTFLSLRPKLVWKWVTHFCDTRLKTPPTPSHWLLNDVIEELGRLGKQVSIVTQSIDNFHEQVQMKSGKKGREHRTCPIYEINGNVLKIRCNHCSIEKGELQSEPYETYEFILSMQSKLYCSSCEGPLRPHILLHDEFYDEIFNSSKTVLTLAEQADLVLVIGSPVLSSLANEVIAVAAQGNKKIVEIDLNCKIQRPQAVRVQLPIGQALSSLKDAIYKK